MPVAFETRDTPPKGSDLASAAAHTRRPRSSSMLHIVRYFCWMARSCFPPMQEEYNLCVDCSSYLCAIPKLTSGGVVTVKYTPLLTTPPTITTTLPEVAPLGTGTAIEV